MTASPEPLALPRLHLITNDVILRGAEFLGIAERLLSAGGERVALHLRGPGLSGRELWDRASACSRVARQTGTALFINDRIDHALACAAIGVQLGRSSIPISQARHLLPAGRSIGASIHGVGEAREAVADGADFLLAGTLFSTPTHPGRQGRGTVWLEELRSLGVPVIGIGGISLDRVEEVIGSGAHGVAVIRGVWEAADPVRALQAYLGYME